MQWKQVKWNPGIKLLATKGFPQWRTPHPGFVRRTTTPGYCGCEIMTYWMALGKIGVCVTACHLHFIGNQCHVSLGKHPSSTILSSRDENLANLWKLCGQRKRGKKASNAAKISSMERTHCTRVLSFILSLPFSLLLHSPTNLQSKHLHPALFMYIFLHVSNLLDLDNEFLLATSALVFTRHPFPVALQGLSSDDWWLMESHGRRSKASNPQSPHGGVGVRQTHEHACEVTDGWCVETSTPLSLAATLPNTSQAMNVLVVNVWKPPVVLRHLSIVPNIYFVVCSSV